MEETATHVPKGWLSPAEVATPVRERVAPIRDLVGATAGQGDRMRINETFLSIQGEGTTSGAPTFFIRTTGCHLRCRWCDTGYAFYEGGGRSLDALVGEAQASGASHVCLTGGEPLLQRPAATLVRRLAEAGLHVTVETSGAVPLDAFRRFPPELREQTCLSVDVKCPGSGEEGMFDPGILRVLWRGDQLKFILADRADFEYAAAWLAANPAPCPAFFHPVGGLASPLARDVAQWMKETAPPARLGLQLHKVLWGDRRGI